MSGKWGLMQSFDWVSRRSHPKGNRETCNQVSKTAGVENWRLTSMFFFMQFLSLSVTQYKTYCVSYSWQNSLPVSVWSQCGRRCRKSWVGLPNFQGGSQDGAFLSRELTNTLKSLPSSACGQHSSINWRPRQKAKVLMEPARLVWSLKIMHVHFNLWAAWCSVWWVAWLPLEQSLHPISSSGHHTEHLYTLDASSRDLHPQMLPLALTKYTSTAPKKQNGNILKS